MLDFDYLCQREKPSVAAMVFPFSGPSCGATDSGASLGRW
jgi:hypothetical protein